MEIIFLGNFKGHGRSFGGATFSGGGISPTILARDYKDPKCVVVRRNNGNKKTR